MLVFIERLSLSTLRWVPMCQSFNHFLGFLHHFVLAKLATSSIRVKAAMLQEWLKEKFSFEVDAWSIWIVCIEIFILLGSFVHACFGSSTMCQHYWVKSTNQDTKWRIIICNKLTMPFTSIHYQPPPHPSAHPPCLWKIHSSISTCIYLCSPFLVQQCGPLSIYYLTNYCSAIWFKPIMDLFLNQLLICHQFKLVRESKPIKGVISCGQQLSAIRNIGLAISGLIVHPIESPLLV